MNPFRLFRRRRDKVVTFILGCHRSGTTMLEKVLGRPDEVSLYGEGNRKAMRVKEFYRFREDAGIRKLIARDPKRFIVFKPINDSQHADRLLELYPGAKAVWIYRSYGDTINSMIRKWGGNQRRIIDWIRDHGDHLEGDGLNEWDGDNWESIFAERISSESLSLIRGLGSDALSQEDAAGLVWYLRNQVYFDRDLPSDPRALLVRYEELVTSPEEELKRIFEFVGLDGHEEYVPEIVASSVGKESPPVLVPEVEELCRGMLEQLDVAREGAMVGPPGKG